MTQIKIFNEAQQTEILRMVADYMGKRQNSSRQHQFDDQDWQATDCYIALTPEEGIDARVDDEPGYADCNIYTIVDDETTPVLQLTEDFQQRVYNLSEDAIDGDIYIKITRDKNGSWLPAIGGGGNGFMGKFASAVDPAQDFGTMLVPGIGLLALWDWSTTGTGTDAEVIAIPTGETDYAYNLSNAEILDDTIVQGKFIGGKRVIDFEVC